MALEVVGECPRVAQDARAGRRRKAGEKQSIEPEQDLREDGDAVEICGDRYDAGCHNQSKIGGMQRFEVVTPSMFETKSHDGPFGYRRLESVIQRRRSHQRFWRGTEID